ncbi:MAG: hypothetical protein PHF86_01170 [Candidatus Nanoarchaeia archaeon]|jgi:hypothetical protein|nr:hypothetical protein [Candidatus Nanoarchaeia archaeon]
MHSEKTKEKIKESWKLRRIKYSMSEEGRESIRKRNKLYPTTPKEWWTEERKKKHSERMKKAILDHLDSYSKNNVSGRTKLYEYKGVKLKGNWELIFAKWLDDNDIIWERDIKPFKYFWNNDYHLYFPDFYLPKLDIFIEVKGYETERDREKWKCLSNLVIIKEKEINFILNKFNNKGNLKYIAGG